MKLFYHDLYLCENSFHVWMIFFLMHCLSENYVLMSHLFTNYTHCKTFVLLIHKITAITLASFFYNYFNLSFLVNKMSFKVSVLKYFNLLFNV